MLPVIRDDDVLLVADPATGEMLALRDAPDRVLAQAAAEIAEHDRQVFEIKRAVARELRDRHGVGAVHAGGHRFVVAESVSWPVKATGDVLDSLAGDGRIGEADVLRCMPERPKPDARQLKALIGRLTVSDPQAAKLLADAATRSPPSVRDVQLESVDSEASL